MLGIRLSISLTPTAADPLDLYSTETHCPDEHYAKRMEILFAGLTDWFALSLIPSPHSIVGFGLCQQANNSPLNFKVSSRTSSGTGWLTH